MLKFLGAILGVVAFIVPSVHGNGGYYRAQGYIASAALFGRQGDECPPAQTLCPDANGCCPIGTCRPLVLWIILLSILSRRRMHIQQQCSSLRGRLRCRCCGLRQWLLLSKRLCMPYNIYRSLLSSCYQSDCYPDDRGQRASDDSSHHTHSHYSVTTQPKLPSSRHHSNDSYSYTYLYYRASRSKLGRRHWPESVPECSPFADDDIITERYCCGLNPIPSSAQALDYITRNLNRGHSGAQWPSSYLHRISTATTRTSWPRTFWTVYRAGVGSSRLAISVLWSLPGGDNSAEAVVLCECWNVNAAGKDCRCKV